MHNVTIKTTGINSFYVRIGDELVATVSKLGKCDELYGKFKYRLCAYGGPAHGKIAYAHNWEDVKVKAKCIADVFCGA